MVECLLSKQGVLSLISVSKKKKKKKKKRKKEKKNIPWRRGSFAEW
jgi:hypothetical protein